jgi:hypothetical protein
MFEKGSKMHRVLVRRPPGKGNMEDRSDVRITVK